MVKTRKIEKEKEEYVLWMIKNGWTREEAEAQWLEDMEGPIETVGIGRLNNCITVCSTTEAYEILEIIEK